MSPLEEARDARHGPESLARLEALAAVARRAAESGEALLAAVHAHSAAAMAGASPLPTVELVELRVRERPIEQ